MLTQEQIDHYRRLGFLHLRRQLDARTVRRLALELNRAFLGAFGDRFAERPAAGGGMTGHYLPVMSASRTPTSLALVTDDRIFGAAEQLLGALPIPDYGEAVLRFGEAGWHRDVGFDVAGVRFAVYLEPLAATTGALRVLPGSHLPEFRRELLRDGWIYRGRRYDLPCHVVETRPGDVVVFDVQTWHASFGGVDRRQWHVSYVKDPATRAERKAFDEFFSDAYEWGDGHRHDRREYPYYDPQWIEDARRDPRRSPLVDRMRELGLLAGRARPRE